MALILNVRLLEGLDGKGERLLKATFRDNVQTSNAASGRDSVYFGQQFKWPVGRRIEITDVLEIRVYNFSKYLANKMIGSLTISLQQLVHESSLKLREQLIDANHSTMRATLDFEINYYSPDSQIGDWRQDEFDYPVPPMRPGAAGEDQEDNASRISFSDAQSLIKENRNMLALAQGDEAGSLMTGEDDASLGNAMRKTLGVPVVLDPTLHKMEDYQLSVTIIEAKQLSGANINPCIEVRVGDRVKRTEIQMSTNSPYYNQYFPFEFHMSKSELFDQVIHIRALNKGTMMISRLFSGDLIGEFRLDVRTVYNAQDHMFFHKWACLIDPKDILGGPKGYVKCDINVIGKGEQMKSRPKTQTRKSKSNDEEDIEANLLLPSGVPIKRQNAEISVRIYRAEDLPKMNTDFMATIKQAITGDSKPLADPYVQVSFAGHSGKTKSKKNTYDPQWNEAIVFTEMFPPLCNRVRISVYDWDTVYNECIATHFIDLNQIMNDAESGFMPTFGPSWINLYGTPRNYSYENMIHPKEELNLGLGEGVAYRGRLLMAIKTEVKTDNSGLTSGARVASTHPVPDTVAGKKEDFLLVGVIYEAGAIDAEIGKKAKPLAFELSIGTYGNRIDGNFNEAFEDDEEDTDPNRKKILPMWCHSVSHPMTPTLTQNEYYHVPFNEKKPCLYMRCNYEDHRPRMFIPNILEKLYTQFEMEIEEMQELVNREKRGVLKRLQRALQTLLDNLEKASLAIRSCRGSAGKTLLDMQRQKTIRVQLEKMKIKAKSMRAQLISSDNVSGRLKECRALVKLLRDLSVDPQHALPDVFVWLIADGQRLAFARIPARQILHSLSEEEKGKDCGKVVTLFLRKPGRKGMGQGGWSLQCQLKMYLWLGLLKDIKHYRTTVPEGYVVDTFKYRRPPSEIVYTEKSYFEFRAYIFMARNLIGSDESGLSDAFARIIINDQVVTTHVIEESLSPMWDRTMIVSPVVFYLNEVTVQDHPPVIVVEIFDEDQVTSVLGGQQTVIGQVGISWPLFLQAAGYAVQWAGGHVPAAPPGLVGDLPRSVERRRTAGRIRANSAGR
ncbi:hypothetical protein BOX15_Mlig001532g2 [Macrostomum lignano]|uniref:C2 domain-containing protein n=1 Tax=Macrostomum lignano TaxID=282301 RepID=A0A267H7D0_9PLAT|nr:hypothetical protein BOX15_Mlig001532g2 [Macrostomum lignano]